MLVLEKRMTRGRPKKLAKTKTVRVYEDLQSMLTWIGRATDEDQADIMDRLCRTAVQKEYAKRIESIEKYHAADTHAARDRNETPPPPLPSPVLVSPEVKKGKA